VTSIDTLIAFDRGVCSMPHIGLVSMTRHFNRDDGCVASEALTIFTDLFLHRCSVQQMRLAVIRLVTGDSHLYHPTKMIVFYTVNMLDAIQLAAPSTDI
jgi:hypothetical protein